MGHVNNNDAPILRDSQLTALVKCPHNPMPYCKVSNSHKKFASSNS
jgi:hypothetical protein